MSTLYTATKWILVVAVYKVDIDYRDWDDGEEDGVVGSEPEYSNWFECGKSPVPAEIEKKNAPFEISPEAEIENWNASPSLRTASLN